jgi:hypothetical protein
VIIIISQNIFSGFKYTADNETVEVRPGVAVSSQTSAGIFSSFSNSKLINSGHIVSDSFGSAGVQINGGTNAKIVNKHGGVIEGFDGLVLIDPGNNTVDNYGRVVATTADGLLFSVDTGPDLLNNYGSILSPVTGVEITSNFSGGVIKNHHLIKGGEFGINVDVHPSGLTTMIHNYAGGVIQGPAAYASGVNAGKVGAIYGQSGKFHLVNFGTIRGDVVDGDGARDVIVNHGTIIGGVDLGTGNDYFNGTGGTVENGIFASGGNDRIIVGEAGTIVNLGGGSSVVTGSPGGDNEYFFNAAPGGYIDRITNFGHGHFNAISLWTGAFPELAAPGATAAFRLPAADFHVGPQATTASQHIIYNPQNGFLYYDHDGNGPLAEIHFATLGPHLHLTNHDFLVQP